MQSADRVLVVEDDPAIAGPLAEFLAAEGFSVASARSQAEALALLEAEPFDIALVDVGLPDGSGFAVCAAAKAHAPRPVPVIFVTAASDEFSTVAGLDMGADDYVAKPFRPRELVSRIRGVLRRVRGDRQLLTLGDVQLDPTRGTATKAGRELYLSALEYRLLLTFMNARGSVLTRAQLADAIWDAAGEYVEDNTITVYVKRLREKIEDDPAAPALITTVRGVGYRVARDGGEASGPGAVR
jgi:DNA-binding response OmpR family regulator